MMGWDSWHDGLSNHFLHEMSQRTTQPEVLWSWLVGMLWPVPSSLPGDDQLIGFKVNLMAAFVPMPRILSFSPSVLSLLADFSLYQHRQGLLHSWMTS